MITRAYIQEVKGGFELHFSEYFPHREKSETSWVDFKKTREDARQIAQQAHGLHIINLVEDLRDELQTLNAPILQPLIDELNKVAQLWMGEHQPNHRQLCHCISDLWGYMDLVITDRAKLIARELQETVKYEMSTNLKKWILQ
jgi:hypothetical protein